MITIFNHFSLWQEHILSDQLSSYETSAMQHQNMGGPFVNDVAGGWLAENGPIQTQLFDASANSAIYETLLQGSSSSSNQNNNMSECNVTNHNGDMFQEWAQAYTSTTGLNPSALFPPIQHQVLNVFFLLWFDQDLFHYPIKKIWCIFLCEKYASMDWWIPI